MGRKLYAKGSNIHLTDSSDNEVVSLSIYGKAEQKQYSGKNLLEVTAESQTINGGTFTVNVNKSITVNGTFTAWTQLVIDDNLEFETGSYKFSGTVGNDSVYLNLYDLTAYQNVVDLKRGETTVSLDETHKYRARLIVSGALTVNNILFEPMIRLASIEDDTYEPYTGGIASPNPDYPQEITVSGSDGSVEVKSVGKNLLKQEGITQSGQGITWTSYDDGRVVANGIANTACIFNIPISLKDGVTYKASGVAGGSIDTYQVYLQKSDGISTSAGNFGDGERTFTKDSDEFNVGMFRCRIASGYTANNITFYPMICLASDTDNTYEPYKETTSTIPTPNGLCGIKVSSGGNYTDENGQQWICDEIVKYADGSGKMVQRIGVIESYNGEEITTDYMSTTGQLTTGAKVLYVLPEPIITDLTAEEIAEIEKLHTFYPVTNISNDANCGMAVTYVSVLIDFIEPKTDWTSTDAFDYVAYNRVTNNVMYLKEIANYLFSRLNEFNLETEKDNLSLIYARHMNDIENGLESINLTTYKLGIGEKKTYKPNGNVPDYQEYNRIESACLDLYNEMQIHKANLPRLAFRLGNQKGIRV